MQEIEPHRVQAYDAAHPIFWACVKNDAARVREYLSKGTPITVSASGCTPLPVVPIEYGATEVLSVLLEAGLDPNMPVSETGSDLLSRAVSFGRLDMLRLLVERGGKLTRLNPYGLTLLHTAAGCGQLEVLRYLLDAGLPLEHRAQDGRTALQEAAGEDQADAMQVLYERGADIEAPDNGQATALNNAAKGGRAEAVRWLLEHGADPSRKDDWGKTALDWARRNQRTAVIELLEGFRPQAPKG